MTLETFFAAYVFFFIPVFMMSLFESRKEKRTIKHRLIESFILSSIVSLLMIWLHKSDFINTGKDKPNIELVREKPFKEKNTNPFSYNVGIDFSIIQCSWTLNANVEYNAQEKAKCAKDRLEKIVEDFRLIRIYSMYNAGWESTGQFSPEATALMQVMHEDASVEAIIGTSCSQQWFLQQSNVDTWVNDMYNNFPCSQVKCILICNEVNANNYTDSTLKIVFDNFKSALDSKNLNIPVSVSFNMLPQQSGLPSSDSMVRVIAKGWKSTWNNGNPFVFVDPYPDGVGGSDKIYDYVYNVQKYYKSLFGNISIFIAETGAEGSTSSKMTVDTVNAIIDLLQEQYVNNKGYTIPTMFFESLDEQMKPVQPNQQHMGLYRDTTYNEGKHISLKSGLKYKSWFHEQVKKR